MSSRPKTRVQIEPRRAEKYDLSMVEGVYPRSLIDLAFNRLNAGDVKLTRFGVRVALRADLGDDRVEAQAYWPDKDNCKCWQKKANDMCSHEVAAIILRTMKGEWR